MPAIAIDVIVAGQQVLDAVGDVGADVVGREVGRVEVDLEADQFAEAGGVGGEVARCSCLSLVCVNTNYRGCVSGRFPRSSTWPGLWVRVGPVHGFLRINSLTPFHGVTIRKPSSAYMHLPGSSPNQWRDARYG